MRIRCFFALLALTYLGLCGCTSSTIARRLPPKVPHVSGYVLDSVSRVPVPNVLVLVHGRGVKTDEKGRFFISNWSHYPFRVGDVATVHTLYYNGKAVVKGTDSNDSLKVLLKRNAFRFPSNSCLPVGDSAKVNAYAQPFMEVEWWLGSQYAFYLKNERRQQLGYLRSITFDVSKLRHSTWGEPFRLRLYQVDSIRQGPGVDLLTENVILCFFRDPTRKTNFITYDVSEFHIPVPAKGLFIGFEGLVTGDKFYMCPPENIPELGATYVPTGEVLRAPCTFSECRTWKGNLKDSGDIRWELLPAADNCWPLYESAISIEANKKTK